jgi:hypothetical protein
MDISSALHASAYHAHQIIKYTLPNGFHATDKLSQKVLAGLYPKHINEQRTSLYFLENGSHIGYS